MREFFKRLLGFGLMVLVVVGFFVGKYNYEYEQRFIDVMSINNSAQILLLGDSHIECSVNDSLWPVFNNMAESGEFYFLSFHKLRRYLQGDSADLKVVCVSFDCYSLLNSHSKSLQDDSGVDIINRYRPIFKDDSSDPTSFGMDISFLEYHKLKLFSCFPNISTLRKQIKGMDVYDTSSYTGGFLNEDKFSGSKKMEEHAKSKLGEHCLEKSMFVSSFASSIVQVDHLKNIGNLLQKHNISFVLLNPPTHKLYNKQINSSLNAYMDSIAEVFVDDYDAYYLDFHEYQLEDSCFRDSDHLNVRGANIFTPMLLDSLKSLGLLD